MNKLLATVVIAATVGMAGTSANAGFLGDVAKVVARRADDAAREKKVRDQGQYGYLADTKYLNCSRYMSNIARNEAERREGQNTCNKNFGYPYRH